MPSVTPACTTEGGISRRVLTVLGMMNVVEGFTMNVIWPFLPFMVENFGVATEETVGLYVGILGASYYLAAMCSSIVWGILADKLGRRPTLLAGTLGTCAANLVFGFAPSYPLAVFGRVLSGLLNSNSGISKTYLGETCTKEQQPAAFATFCVMYGLGSVIAPAIGGFLSQPADKYPGTFSKAGLYGRFPFALPTLIAAILSLLAFAAGSCLLPETKAYQQRRHAQTASASEVKGLVSRSESINNFDEEHPRRSVFGSFSSSSLQQRRSHKKETHVFRAHMIVSPLVAWHEVSDMWHELKDIVTHSVSRGMSRSSSYARLTDLAPANKGMDVSQQQRQAVVSSSHAAADESAKADAQSQQVAETSEQAGPGSQHAAGKQHKHARFADADDYEPSAAVTDGNESITAVRPAGSSHAAEGSFWRHLDANGSFTDQAHDSQASIKDAVKAALAGGANASMSPARSALGLLEERRVSFWNSPHLQSPGVQERLHAAWSAVQSPTGRAVLAYLMMGGIGTLYDELLPIYCSEDLADGGLGMTSGQIGQILMVCGCALMIFQMFGYSRLSKALGPLRLLYLSCWGHVLMMLLPAFGVLVVQAAGPGSWALWGYMTLAQVYKAIITGLCFTSVFICISNSAPNAKKGLVNGVSMSGVALVRAVTPVAGGLMWDWSVSMTFALHSFVPFVIMACISVGLGLISTMPRELASPYPDAEGDSNNHAVGAGH